MVKICSFFFFLFRADPDITQHLAKLGHLSTKLFAQVLSSQCFEYGRKKGPFSSNFVQVEWVHLYGFPPILQRETISVTCLLSLTKMAFHNDVYS